MNNTKFKLNPYWVTGFTDAEGCFTVCFLKNKRNYRVQAIFEIELHIKDISLLVEIKSYFQNVGTICINKNKNSANYKVCSIYSIMNVIIPHFEKYPLITQKQSDFLIFIAIVKLINNNEHLTKEGLNKIISLKASLNNGLSEKLSACCPKINKIDKIERNFSGTIDFYWIAGFFNGESCFYVNIVRSKTCMTGFSVKLRISVTQHLRDEFLMNKLANTLKCGKVYTHSKNTVVLMISPFEDIYHTIIPLLKTYRIRGVKSLNFKDFCLVAELMNKKAHLTLKGLEQIRKIKSGMNKGRC